MKAAQWYVYVVQCANGTLYTGVTTNVFRRVEEHNTGELGAKYTRTSRPVVLVHQQVHASRSDACKREAAIKRLTRAQKLALIATGNPAAK